MHQSSTAMATGEPNMGRREVGGGREGECFLKTNAIEGTRDGDCEVAHCSHWVACSKACL